MNGPVHLPAAVRQFQPWKNGGGRTATIIEVPAGARPDDLNWRISIADIETPGPFSFFPGMTRYLLVMTGSVHLSGRNVEVELGMDDGPVTFPGDTAIVATPLAMPVRVLNVMVRTDRFRGAVRRVSSDEMQMVRHETILVAVRSTMIAMDDLPYPLIGEDGLVFAEAKTVCCRADIIRVDIIERLQKRQ